MTQASTQHEHWLMLREEATCQAMPLENENVRRALFQQLVDWSRNPPYALRDCKPENLFECALIAARAGLELDSPLQHAHAVPFRTKGGGSVAKVIVGYRGLCHIMRNSGDVKAIHTGTICENDSYEWTDKDFTLHRTVLDRGPVVAVFCKIELNTGGSQSEVMTVEEVEHIRKKSRAKDDGPWVNDWTQMARKTVLRRAANLVEWSPWAAKQIRAADRTEFEDSEVEIKGPPPKRKPRGVADLEAEATEVFSDDLPDFEVDPETGETIPAELPREE